METVHATHTLFAFFALANADLLLARHYLPAETAGSYAVGSAIAKIAFWLPASVGLVAFPDLVDHQRRASTLRAAFTLLAGVGVGSSSGPRCWATGSSTPSAARAIRSSRDRPGSSPPSARHWR